MEVHRRRRHDSAWATTTRLHLHLQFFAELECPGRVGYVDAPHSAFSCVALIRFNGLRVKPMRHTVLFDNHWAT